MKELIILTALLVVHCYGFRYGPPLEACTHMFPTLHGFDARNDNPPFQITVSKNNYSPNERITVTITPDANDPDNSTRDWFMEGILVQARRADCSTRVPVGTFELGVDCDDFLQVIDCLPFGSKNAIRHYTHVHAKVKTFTWIAPATAVGHVYISATIARNKERFWMNVKSENIMDPTDSTTGLQVCPPLQTKYIAPATTGAAVHIYIPTLTILFALVGAFVA